jgi:hypothetical protein
MYKQSIPDTYIQVKYHNAIKRLFLGNIICDSVYTEMEIMPASTGAPPYFASTILLRQYDRAND